MSMNPTDSDSVATQMPVAIIGVGCLFPKASNVNEFWANIRDGRDCIGDPPATHWRVNDYYDPDPGATDMTFGRLGGCALDPADVRPRTFGQLDRGADA